MMCSEGKCCCLKLETGTLIFGVITSTLNAFGILGCTIGLIVVNVAWATYQPPQNQYDYDFMGQRVSVGNSYDRTAVAEAAMLAGNCGLAIALLKTVIDFTFSVMLCIGVNKRQPSKVKAYFIYGIVMSVLFCLAVLIAVAVIGDVSILVLGIVPLTLYGLILHMIKLTHQKLSAGHVYGFEHKPLQESIY